jgi:cytoskeleton protein RodZ
MAQSTIGERLRQAREAIPASLYQASRETKIRVDFLEYMERDNFRFMTGGTYIRGLLRSYGRWLRLDGVELEKEFERLHAPPLGPSVKQIFKEPAVSAKGRRPHWVIAAAVAAVILMAFSLAGLMGSPSKVASPPTDTEERRVAAPTTAPESAAQPPAQVAQAPPVQGVQVKVDITGTRSWMSVRADESQDPIFEATLRSGESKTFEAKDQLVIVFGNLGAVTITVNGRTLGVPGNTGETGRLVFAPDTTAFTKVS